MTTTPLNGYDGPLYLGGTDQIDGFHRVLIDDSIVPKRSAPWTEEVSIFALSFDGFEAFGGIEEPLALQQKAMKEWNTSQKLPSDLSLAQLRGILHYERRYFGHQGETPQPGPDRNFIDDLLDGIRLIAAGNRNLDPTPQSPGEHFARLVMELAKQLIPSARLSTRLREFDRHWLQELFDQIDRTYELPKRDTEQPWQVLVRTRWSDGPWLDEPPNPRRRPIVDNVVDRYTISDLIETWLPHVVTAPVSADDRAPDSDTSSETRATSVEPPPTRNLTSRERQVLELRRSGMTPDEIGHTLQIAGGTIRRIIAKLAEEGHQTGIVRKASSSRPDATESKTAPQKSHPSEPREDESSDVLVALQVELRRLKKSTLDRLGMNTTTEGIELFMKGVEAHTRLVLRPDRDLRQLVEMKPGFLPMPIYMGAIDTIHYMMDKSSSIQLPLDLRGFMASFSLVSRLRVVEAGIDFDPGEGNEPSDFFDLLGISDDLQHMSERTPEQQSAHSQEPAVATESVVESPPTREATPEELSGPELAVRNLRGIANDLGLPVNELPGAYFRADDAFEVQVGTGKQVWWDTITVWRLPMPGTTTFQVSYKRISDTQGRPISPEKAVRIMHKAARRHGSR